MQQYGNVSFTARFLSLDLIKSGSMPAGQKAALERARFYSQVLLTD